MNSDGDILESSQKAFTEDNLKKRSATRISNNEIKKKKEDNSIQQESDIAFGDSIFVGKKKSKISTEKKTNKENFARDMEIQDVNARDIEIHDVNARINEIEFNTSNDENNDAIVVSNYDRGYLISIPDGNKNKFIMRFFYIYVF